jgi:hypothetical protein
MDKVVKRFNYQLPYQMGPDQSQATPVRAVPPTRSQVKLQRQTETQAKVKLAAIHQPT